MTTEEERITTNNATIDEEETTIESVTIATIPQIMTVEETRDDTRNDGSTPIRIDSTWNVKGTGTVVTTTGRERITERNVGNRPGNTEGRRILKRSSQFHNWSNGG